MEGITGIDYRHAKKVSKEFVIVIVNHGLYVQCNTLFIADMLENFRNKCIEIHKLDSPYFLTAPSLTWQACLKEARI